LKARRFLFCSLGLIFGLWMIVSSSADAVELGSVTLELNVANGGAYCRLFLADSALAEINLFTASLDSLTPGVQFTLDSGEDFAGAVALITGGSEYSVVLGLFGGSGNFLGADSKPGSDLVSRDTLPLFQITSFSGQVSLSEVPDGDGGQLLSATLTVNGSPKQPGGLITVAFDIHPTSCPNPFNMEKKGVVPAAILGTGDFDVQKIDVNTIQLLGLSPIRFAYEDVATPFPNFTGKDCFQDCWEEGPDGIPDLTLKFAASDFAKALGDVTDRECRVLKITGSLKQEDGGTPIEGEDVVLILLK